MGVLVKGTIVMTSYFAKRYLSTTSLVIAFDSVNNSVTLLY